MPEVGNKCIGVVEAATIIYRTGSPSDEQVNRVCRLMMTGVLPASERRGEPLKWRTTETALARYLATNQMLRDAQSSPPAHAAAISAFEESHQEDAKELEGVYFNVWRDYFLSVLLRRRLAHRSGVFHKAVTAGQLVIVLSFLVTLVATIVSFSFRSTPPERKAIEQWIEAQTDDYAITRWHSSEPVAGNDEVLVRVEYRYQKNSPKWIHTDRTFSVVDKAVTELMLD